MAQYENLPVFKATYDLLLDVYARTKNVPRDLLVLIYKANSCRDKEPILRECLDRFLAVRLRIRLLKDMCHISISQFAQLALKTETISKQLTAWHKYAATNIKPPIDSPAGRCRNVRDYGSAQRAK